MTSPHQRPTPPNRPPSSGGAASAGDRPEDQGQDQAQNQAQGQPQDPAQPTPPPPAAGRLDPTDWEAFRASCHQVVDEMVERFRHQAAGEGPVWQDTPPEVRARLDAPLPTAPAPLDEVLERVRTDILPYTLGNTHPRFFGWVHGSGTPSGALAEFLAGAMNANTGGRDHAPIRVEEQVVRWVRELFGFPATASGLVVSGTSMATIVGLAVARHAATRGQDRARGIQATTGLGGTAGHRGLVGYATLDGHRSIQDAFSLLGLGADALRAVPMKADGSMDTVALERQVVRDRSQGFRPFTVVATSGSVTCGAMDDLVRIREIADTWGLWMHVDGAFGAAARLSPALAPSVAGIEHADSLAFDFHKWLHVPYDAGFILVRDGELHRATFEGRADYLSSLDQGPAAGDIWPCDLGPELSRGFRAFKVWFALEHLGVRALGDAVEANVRQARLLADRVRQEAELELLAPADLNIVCFRYRPASHEGVGTDTERLNELNRDLLLRLHHLGIAVPSPILRGDAFGIRVCITNHRTRDADLELLVQAVLKEGRILAAQPVPASR